MATSPGADAAFAEATRRRLKWLMAARLGLSLGVFALTLLFIGYGRGDFSSRRINSVGDPAKRVKWLRRAHSAEKELALVDV